MNNNLLNWQVHTGFNCYIDIHPACNASCPFCIAPTRGRKSGPQFFDGMKFALDFTEKINGTIQIVGGEPLISKRLIPLLEMVSHYGIRRTVLNTNGSYLSDSIIDKFLDAGVTHVNISRHHYDESSNQEIMEIRPEIGNDKLAKSISSIIKSGISLRLQCNLIKGHIDSVDKMIAYLDWCNKLGAERVSFSQVFLLGLFDYSVFSNDYTRQVQVDLQSIVKEMDYNPQFISIPGPPDEMNSHGGTSTSAWGSYKRRFWRYHDSMDLSVKTFSGYHSDGLPRETMYVKSLDPELQDGLISFAVVHADGLVTASWDRRERILFDPNQFGLSALTSNTKSPKNSLAHVLQT